jgi:myo-inositol-1(or 4)-monophosphatase
VKKMSDEIGLTDTMDIIQWRVQPPAWTKTFGEFTQIAMKAALVAAHILEEKRGSHLLFAEKEGAANVVTEADIKAEREIIKIILSKFPNHGILSEETKSDEVPEHDYIWIVDPLDGSKNYSKGLPIYSISIALLYKGEPITGVIFAPCLKDLFIADLKGTYLNGKQTTVTKTDKLGKALLASGYPYAVKQNPLNCMEVENGMIQSGAQVNHLGTSVLQLAYIAAGIFDGQFHAGLRSWDLAAASLMIKQAGGILSHWNGDPVNLLTLDVIDVVASNGQLHAQMIEKIKEAKK